MNRDRLLQRFLRYVQIDSTARPEAEGYPSSPGQLEVGRLLLGELQALGLADARQDQHGIVLATVPGRRKGTVPICAKHRAPPWSGRPGKWGLSPFLLHGRPVLPPRHLAGDQRGRHPSAGDRKLRRRRRCPARRQEPSDPRGRQPRHGIAPRPNADHLRRHDPVGRRRQGRRGHHHGDGRMAAGASRDCPLPAADLLHLRRGDRPRRRQARSEGDRLRPPATRSTATPAARSTSRRFRPTRRWSRFTA